MVNNIIGLARRPQIIIREFDETQVPQATQTGVVTLVPGVSKAGNYNRIKRIEDPITFERLFGTRDRSLENKDSFFHLAALNALQQGPILAVNLLLTDPELDLVDSLSLSTATQYSNSGIKQIGYNQVHDTNGFWRLSSENYLFNVNKGVSPVTDMLHFTNIKDTPVTIWVWKSKLRGYDVTAEEWYGSIDDVPSFINPKDYIEDYMVKVLMVSGDYTNVEERSQDPFWSRYFNERGLRKERADEFSTSPRVNVLGNFDASLIPYFRDEANRDIYIESLVNGVTDDTGIFCTYDKDQLIGEPDRGLVDLTGETLLLDSTRERINLLSYDTGITEDVFYENTSLDVPGNVWGVPWTSATVTAGNDRDWRNAKNANGYINDLWLNNSDVLNFSSLELDDASNYIGDTEFTAEFSTSGTDPYIIYDNAKVEIAGFESGNTQTLTMEFPSEGNPELGYYIVYTVCVNAEGEIYYITGEQKEHTYEIDNSGSGPVVSGTTKSPREKIEEDFVHNGGSTPDGRFKDAILPNNNDHVLGVVFSMSVKDNTGGLYGGRRAYYYPVAINNDTGNGFVNPDFLVTNIGPNALNVEFLYTTDSDLANSDLVWGRRNMFYYNDFDTRIDNESLVLFDETAELFGVLKLPLSKTVVTQNENGTDNRAFTVTADTSIKTGDSGDADAVVSFGTDINGLIFYRRDDELIFGPEGVNTRANIRDTASDFGVIGSAHRLYLEYEQGFITNGDEVIAKSGEIQGATWDNTGGVYTLEFDTSGTSYAPQDFEYALTKMKVVTSTEFNDGEYNIESVTNAGSVVTITLSESVIADVSDISIYFIQNQVPETRYIKAYKYNDNDGDSVMRVEFAGDDLITADSFTPTNLAPDYNITGINVISGLSNFEQTLEIQEVIRPDLITVNAERYAEVAEGDFLTADTTTQELETGEIPRLYVRVIDKVIDPNDPDRVRIQADGAIKVTEYANSDATNGVDLQTSTYKSLDNYVTEYKGYKVNGFKVRPESLPDGTQERQDQILNLMAPGTPFYKQLTNRRSTSYRYILDTFGLGLQTQSKQQLADLAAGRVNALALASAPSVRQFRESTTPSFVDNNGSIDYSFVRRGADPNKIAAYRYSLAGPPGDSHIAYFHPHAIVNDRGVPKRVPMALFAHGTFMAKHNTRSSSIRPWTPASGLNYGVVRGIAGVEIDLDNTALDELHDAGINGIVFESDTDYVIFDNLTAKIRPRSALSDIHTREALISLEDDLIRMLKRYQWRFNTPETRESIFNEAEAICQIYQQQDAISNYLNVIDETNNTERILSANMGVLDTFIEPVSVFATIVNNIRIVRRGVIESSGFSELVA